MITERSSKLPPSGAYAAVGQLPLVSVITVNYNQHEVTEALLKSILSTARYPRLEIIVVDNGSKVDPVALWSEKYPDVVFLRSHVNLGFAGGNNLGISSATGDLLFFVNNDTEFTPLLLVSMVSYMQVHRSVGIASPKIMYHEQPEIIQYAGFTRMNYFTCRNKCIGQHEQDQGQYDGSSGPTGYVHGAAMMVRRTALKDAGMMPEGYFLYYEEMDWCESIRRAGYDVHINTEAAIYHKESLSVGKISTIKEYFMNRNRILFIRRNAPWIAAGVFYIYFLAFVTPRNIIRYIHGKEWGFIGVFIRALLWHTRHSSNSNDTGFVIT